MLGIVRKIDSLGRIVIPKEIRKNLMIKNNDDIEINIKEDKIIISKYYRLKSIEQLLKKHFIILNKYLISDYILTDKEKILFIKNKENDTYLDDNKLCVSFVDMIDERKQVLDNKIKPLKINSKNVLNGYYLFTPIVINTDVLGSMVIFSDKPIQEKDVLVINIIVQLIKNELEC